MDSNFTGGEWVVAILLCAVNTVVAAGLLAKIWLPDLLARLRGGGSARR